MEESGEASLEKFNMTKWLATLEKLRCKKMVTRLRTGFLTQSHSAKNTAVLYSAPARKLVCATGDISPTQCRVHRRYEDYSEL